MSQRVKSFEPVNDLSKSLCPNAALVKYITSRIISIDLIRISNGRRPKYV